MKIVITSLVVLSILSCSKKDKINHYLTKKITAKELIENGFYKYSYADTIDDEDKVDDTIRAIIIYDMYSNVKPEKNKNGESFPTQLTGFRLLDSVKRNKRINYLENELNNRIITYVFRNDSLFYKDIIVYSYNKSKNKLADLTSKEKSIFSSHRRL